MAQLNLFSIDEKTYNEMLILLERNFTPKESLSNFNLNVMAILGWYEINILRKQTWINFSGPHSAVQISQAALSGILSQLCVILIISPGLSWELTETHEQTKC